MTTAVGNLFSENQVAEKSASDIVSARMGEKKFDKQIRPVVNSFKEQFNNTPEIVHLVKEIESEKDLVEAHNLNREYRKHVENLPAFKSLVIYTERQKFLGLRDGAVEKLLETYLTYLGDNNR